MLTSPSTILNVILDPGRSRLNVVPVSNYVYDVLLLSIRVCLFPNKVFIYVVVLLSVRAVAIELSTCDCVIPPDAVDAILISPFTTPNVILDPAIKRLKVLRVSNSVPGDEVLLIVSCLFSN